MGYCYEMHCHSKEGSACSDFPVAAMIRFYKDHGYDGIVLTDHFTGNSTLPDELPWKEFVERYYETYDVARAEGERVGLKVFSGMEYSLSRGPESRHRCTGNDFLILGLEREWVLENEDKLINPRPNEVFDAVHVAGGYIIHAHPYLEAEWVEYIRLLPRKVDAVEIINGCQDDACNDMARHYAEHYGLAVTAGSDIHHLRDAHVLCCVETQAPCRDVRELIAQIDSRSVIARRNA